MNKEQLAEEYAESRLTDPGDEVWQADLLLRDSLKFEVKEGWLAGHAAASEWIAVGPDTMPPYGVEVVCARPNKYSGKVDVIHGYLHKAEECGRTYGSLSDFPRRVTHGDYWSFPAVAPLSAVTHWQHKPSPPNQ